MTVTSMPTVSTLIKRVTANIDLDTAVTMAELLNWYHAAIKRMANRSTLGPEDVIKILHMHNQMMEACEAREEAEMDFVAARNNGHKDASATREG